LLDFLGLTDPQRERIKLDPKARKMQLLDFVRTLPRSTREPVSVVVIEDLHWIDPASEEFVEALADAVVETTSLLIVNFRPGFAAPLTHRSYYRQINMRPLPAAQATILVQDHFGGVPSLALLSISRNIVERAQGNPYLQVYGRACRGVADMVARRLTSAIQDLSDALSFARLRKAGLEAEPRILADLANAYRLNGDTATALTIADEAIKFAMERHARIPECLARATRAHLMLTDRAAEAQLEICRSKFLLKETAAKLFSRFIDELDTNDSGVSQISNDRTANS
jgi:hypothetical protein